MAEPAYSMTCPVAKRCKRTRIVWASCSTSSTFASATDRWFSDKCEISRQRLARPCLARSGRVTGARMCNELEWERGALLAWTLGTMRRQLEHGVIYEEGYFDRGAVAQLVREHASAACDHSDELWPLLSLGLWADRFHGLDGA